MFPHYTPNRALLVLHQLPRLRLTGPRLAPSISAAILAAPGSLSLTFPSLVHAVGPEGDPSTFQSCSVAKGVQLKSLQKYLLRRGDPAPGTSQSTERQEGWSSDPTLPPHSGPLWAGLATGSVVVWFTPNQPQLWLSLA